MARDINIIQQQIIDNLAAKGIVVSDNAFSRRRIWTYVIAFCIQVMELIVDTGKAEIDDTIANKNPHTLQYLQNLVLAFQYGYDLVPEQTYYDNTGLSEEVINASKIVAHCSISRRGRILAVKVAKSNGSDLINLSAPEALALQAYCKRVFDAGVFFSIVNISADSLKFNADIYYNPMLIDGNGTDIIYGKPVIENALNNYLYNLPFNGKFSLQKLVDALQAVAGVEDLKVNSISVKSAVGGVYENVTVYYFPASGYLRILNKAVDLRLNFLPNAD